MPRVATIARQLRSLVLSSKRYLGHPNVRSDMKARDEVLRLLADRAPNFVPERIIQNRLKNLASADVSSALVQLSSDGLIERVVDQRPTGEESEPFFRLKDTKNVPIRRSIRIAGIELPRVTSDSGARFFPEIYNESLEILSEYASSLEDRFKEIVRDQEQRYWAKVSGLFATLVSVLALLFVGLPKITTDPSLPFLRVVLLNLGQVLPMAVVLALFVLVLKWILR